MKVTEAGLPKFLLKQDCSCGGLWKKNASVPFLARLVEREYLWLFRFDLHRIGQFV